MPDSTCTGPCQKKKPALGEVTARTCTGPCQKKRPDLAKIATGAAILGLTAALAGCPPILAQPEYGVAADDDDSAEVGDDDDSTEDVNQPLYGAATDPD